ncbi:MAG: hypothetical protein JXB49_21515 [Bacteroidales bacterium]|nr:hypothetical protein [Bacteroidales bacterium]
MKDTTDDIRFKQFQIIQSKTPQERFKIGLEMIEFGIETVKQNILSKNPGINERELKKQVFLRCYKNDFTDDELEKIYAFL